MWEDELNKILIDYDFDKDVPGTFDFIEAEKKIVKLIESLLKQQREICARKITIEGLTDWRLYDIREVVLNAPPPTGDKK